MNVYRPLCTVTARYYYYQILKKDKICGQILKKVENVKFHEKPTVGVPVILRRMTEKQTDRHD
jgi:hypothetical protein